MSDADVRSPSLEGDHPLWSWLLGLAAGLLVLRYGTLLLTDLSLHGDEAQYWTWSWTFEFGYYSKPPLIGWVIGTATSVCSDASWCIRSPAALLHIATAFILAALALDLFDRKVAFWTGVAWLTVPAVSYSSLIMSTDAVLLTCWAGTLLAYRWVLTRPSWGPVLLLAVTFGLGLNAKYAMSYVLLGLLVHLLLSAEARQLIRKNAFRLALGFGFGAAMILPNVYWNATNGWATVGHTADNAHWQGIVLHFEELGDFLSAQLGVFGPIFLIVLLLLIPRSRKAFSALPETTRFLLAFSLPILIVISVQAILSRANANWAATAYPAATILVTAWLLFNARRALFLYASIGLHALAALGFYGMVVFPDLAPRAMAKKLGELEGWQETASQVQTILDTQGTSVLLMDNRLMTASMAYALRDTDVVIRAWNHDLKIDHHYEMAWLYDPAVDGPRVLLLTPHGTEPYAEAFDTVTDLPPILRHDRRGRETVLHVQMLEGPQ